MGNIVQYSVNIAMEATIMLFLILLLMASFWQKHFFATAVSFRYLLALMILLLANQIVTWGFLIGNVPGRYGNVPMRVVYTLDFGLAYAFGVAFFYYVETLVKAGYERRKAIYTPNDKIHRAILVWGVLSTVTYAIFISIPSVYHVENGKAVFSMLAYVGMQGMVRFAFICAIVLIIRRIKAIGMHDAVLCLTFAILASLFIVVDELCGLCISYVLMSMFIFILYVRIDLYKGLLLERQEKEIVKGKTQIMLSQMQPHFMYNILTTISSLCEMQNAIRARDVVNRFAEYLRTNLDALGNDKMISFERELEHVKTYLWLEKIRFEDALNIRYEIETTDFSLPSLIVQPMVENAVKHGILPKEDAGTLTLKTYETDDSYVVEVADDGVGFDPTVKKNDNRSHVGIENVRQRLEVICHGKCEIHSEIGKGTVVTISVPKGERL